MNPQNLLGYAALAMAALGSWYLVRTLQTPEVEPATRNTQADSFDLKSARVLGTGEDGSFLYEIAAEYGEQWPSEEIELRNLQIRYTPDASVPWTLNADTATIGSNQERLVLSG